MKFENKDTIDLEDFADIARPALSRWKLAGAVLLAVVACALASASLLGCGQGDETADVDAGSDAGAAASPALESSAQALSGVTFGNSSFNLNYQCRQGNCTCDNTTHTGRDCSALRHSGRCIDDLFCFVSPTTGRELCICSNDSSNSCGPGGCSGPIAKMLPSMIPTGYIQNGINVFWRVDGSNTTCLVPPQDQTLPTCLYPATNGETLQELNATYSGKYCVPAEYGPEVRPSGIYQAPSTLLYKVFGRRGCRLSSYDWSRIPHTPITQITDAVAAQIDGGPCLEMELFTN